MALPGLLHESVYIRVNNPTLNRNIGKFNLHHIWDRVFLNTPGLKINKKLCARHEACSKSTQPNTPTPLNQPTNLHTIKPT